MPSGSLTNYSTVSQVSQQDHPVDYRSIGKQTAAKVELLYCDIQRLLRRDQALTPTAIATMAGLSSEWVVREIRKPGWYVKNVASLFQIEAALMSHPLWFPKEHFGDEDREAPGSYVYRRWVDPYQSPEFQKDALRWSVRESDRAFFEEFRQEPWVSVVDVDKPFPSEYRIISYAREVPQTYGFNKQGIRLADNPSTAYSELVAQDFRDTIEGLVPRCKDFVHVNTAHGARSVFRTIAIPFPAEGLVLSKVNLEVCQPGRLTFGNSSGPQGIEKN